MMRVAEIWRYPVKSMAGERVDDADLGINGIPGDRVVYVVDGDGDILSARTRPGLLAHHATLDAHGNVLVDEQPWDSAEVTAAVHAAAGPTARLIRAEGPERFDILPLLVTTDGAIRAFGHDHRRLRPNLVLDGVPGLTEREWEGRQLQIGEAVIQLATLRGRCIMTTYDPDTHERNVNVLREINARFAGTFALNAWAGRPGAIGAGEPATLLAETVQVDQPALGRYAPA